MKEISEMMSALGGMPVSALFVAVILSAFGLAAFAIYAVMTVSKGRRNGD
jgi:hypothetical protein